MTSVRRVAADRAGSPMECRWSVSRMLRVSDPVHTSILPGVYRHEPGELPPAAPAARRPSRLARSSQPATTVSAVGQHGMASATWAASQSLLSNTVRRVAVAYLATGPLWGASAIDVASPIKPLRHDRIDLQIVVDLRTVGVYNRDHVRPSLGTRCGKATRRDPRARRRRR